jgi:long-chain acyl-CoA synthetase
MADTVLSRLSDASTTRPESTAVLEKRLGRWQRRTLAELFQLISELAAGLHHGGAGPGETVGLMLEGHLEWIAADLGIQATGARVVAVSVLDPPDLIALALESSGARTVLVEGQDTADVILDLIDRGLLTSIEKIAYRDPAGVEEYTSDLLVPMADIRAVGVEAIQTEPDLPARLIGDRSPADEAVVAFTSGSSNDSRGAVLTHGNLLAAAEGTVQAFRLNTRDRVVALRRMDDYAERGASIYPALLSGALLALPESNATTGQAMVEIAPTYVHVTARYLKVLASQIRARLDENRGIKRLLAILWDRWTKGSLDRYGDASTSGWASRLLFGFPVREKLGMEKARAIVSSGAPLPRELMGFFTAMGFPLRNGYALAEVGGFAAVSRIGELEMLPLPGIDAELDDERLHLSGAALAPRYLDGSELRAKLATGDIAQRVGDSLLILGRAEPSLASPSGSGVPVAHLEQRLRASPYLLDAVVEPTATGFRISAELDPATIERWVVRHGLEATTYRTFAQSTEVHNLIEETAHQLIGMEGTIEGIEILPEPLDKVDGALTPSGTPRRRVLKLRN